MCKYSLLCTFLLPLGVTTSSKSNPSSEKNDEIAQPTPTPEKVRVAPVITDDDKIQSSPKENLLTNGVVDPEKVPFDLEDSSSDSESAEEQPDPEQVVEDSNEVWTYLSHPFL